MSKIVCVCLLVGVCLASQVWAQDVLMPEHVSIQSAYTTPEQAAQSIAALANQLEARGDRRSLFPHIYALTIQATLVKLQQGRFYHPKWVRALILNYANIYRRTIMNELGGHRSRVALSWQLDFAYDQNAKQWSPDLDVVYGISVHISRDLVEALFQTPADFNSQTVTADYFLISQALRETMPEIWAVFTRYGNSVGLPACLQQSIMSNWIAHLREVAYRNAKTGAGLSAGQQAVFLNKIDQIILGLARKYGLQLPLQP